MNKKETNFSYLLNTAHVNSGNQIEETKVLFLSSLLAFFYRESNVIVLAEKKKKSKSQYFSAFHLTSKRNKWDDEFVLLSFQTAKLVLDDFFQSPSAPASPTKQPQQQQHQTASPPPIVALAPPPVVVNNRQLTVVRQPLFPSSSKEELAGNPINNGKSSSGHGE